MGIARKIQQLVWWSLHVCFLSIHVCVTLVSTSCEPRALSVAPNSEREHLVVHVESTYSQNRARGSSGENAGSGPRVRVFGDLQLS